MKLIEVDALKKKARDEAKGMTEPLATELPIFVDWLVEKMLPVEPERKSVYLDDLTSRKWLIKCVEEGWIKFDTENDKNKCIHLVRDMAVSAQPEMIRCKDCKYAEVADKEDGHDGYTCQFHRGSIWFSGSYCSWAVRRPE